MTFLLIILALCILYLLSLRGRRNHPGLAALRGWCYAHRGLHSEGRPENSMAAFRAALEGGFGIELDIHLLKDGNLAVIHDSDLFRVTGQQGKVEDLTTEQLKDYPLMGTGETIPEFRQVLELFAGKAPMIVELKSAGGNAAKLTETACKMLADYPGVYCMESFDPACIRWLWKNRPQIIRGQLADNTLRRSNIPYPLPVRLVTTFYLENFLTCPDFIAYRFEDRKTLSNFLCRKVWRLQGVSWTLRTKEDFDTALREGWLPIFEKFIP